MNTLHRVLQAALVVTLAAGGGTLIRPVMAAGPASPPQCASVTVATCKLAASLGKGINMGGMLDAPNEGDWGARLDPSYIDLVADKFQTVRIPVRWSNHATPDENATIDPVFLKRVTSAVDAFISRGMHVILDVHQYSQIFGDKLLPKEFGVDENVVEQRLVNIWRQLGEHYKNHPPQLIFELLNEPHGRLNAQAWNGLYPKLLSVVREKNPERAVMIGPADWNAIKDLPKMRIPRDRNVIVSVHSYEPFFFTHQGVSFLPMPMPTGVSCCDTSQRGKMVQDLQDAKSWSIQYGYPIHLGEFGVYKAADLDSRVNYIKVMVSESERLDIPWAYWDFANAFGVYNPKTGKWIEPMVRALTERKK